jgi:hypothetical protein
MGSAARPNGIWSSRILECRKCSAGNRHRTACERRDTYFVGPLIDLIRASCLSIARQMAHAMLPSLSHTLQTRSCSMNRLFVPYTNQVLDLDGKGNEPREGTGRPWESASGESTQVSLTSAYIPKYLEREALDQFIPVYGLAAHSLTSLSHFVCSAFFSIDLSSWHHLTSIRFEGKRRRFSLAFKVSQVSIYTWDTVQFGHSTGGTSSSSDKQSYWKLR